MVYPLQKTRKGSMVLLPEEKLRLLSMVDIVETLKRVADQGLHPITVS